MNASNKEKMNQIFKLSLIINRLDIDKLIIICQIYKIEYENKTRTQLIYDIIEYYKKLNYEQLIDLEMIIKINLQTNSIAETPNIDLNDKNNTISPNCKNNVDNIKNSNSYFEKQWKPNCIYDDINIIPIFNYYNFINSIEFDINALFLTNNIAEAINRILNSHLNSKYPLFDEWRKAILTTEEKVNLNFEENKRVNYISKIFIFYIILVKSEKFKLELLNEDDILRLNSIILPCSNISNILTISQILQTNTYVENQNDDNDDQIGEDSYSKDPNIIVFTKSNEHIFKTFDNNPQYLLNLQNCIKFINLVNYIIIIFKGLII